MATKEKNTSYNRAKDAFEALDLEDKAVFLIDAVFKTVLGGMEQFTTAVSDAVDDLTNRTYADGDSDDDETSADKTVKRQSAAKKSSTRKASTKKASARKSAAKKSSRTSSATSSPTQDNTDE